MQNLRKSSSPKLLNRILRYCTQIVLGHVLSKFVQMVAPPTLLPKKIAKNILNIVYLMQTFEKSSSPKLLDRILRYCTQIVFGYVLLMFVQIVAPPTLSAK